MVSSRRRASNRRSRSCSVNQLRRYVDANWTFRLEGSKLYDKDAATIGSDFRHE